jgi:hypothetical protein
LKSAREAGQEALLPDADVLGRALLGEGLPEAAEWHLWEAGLAYQKEDVAEAHLHEARRVAPDHAAVLIGLYRFYFYKGRLREALQIALVCLAKAAKENGLALDWREVRPGDADFGSYEAVLPRFYLFTLKAYAYLRMRLGEVAEGREAVAKLLELDPTDKLGGRVLMGVLNRIGKADDDE